MVARVSLHNMRQERDEPIRAFGARLRGQASVCKFAKACTGCGASVNYAEDILVDVLCRGLADTEIQMDLLGDPNQEMTVEQALRFVEAKEAGKRSASRLSLPQTAEALGSSYQRQKKPTHKTTEPREDPAVAEDTARAPPPGFEGPSAQHSGRDVTTAGENTTWKRYVEVRPGMPMHSMRVPFLIPCVTSPPHCHTQSPPSTTTYSTNLQALGPSGSRNHSHTSAYGLAPTDTTINTSGTHSDTIANKPKSKPWLTQAARAA